jgi:opacity protein-like surface antigen
MSIFSSRSGLALALLVAALCLGGRNAHAQAAPVSYWLPNWPIGFGGDPTAGGENTYGNFPGFNGSGAVARYNFSNGWFVGSEGGGIGLGMNGFNQTGAFGNFGSLSYQGTQFGYNFEKAHGLPLTVYAGFDTLKYNSGIGSPFAPFDSTSTTLPGYSAHAGIEYKPTSNLSLSLGFGYTQQSGRIDSDINSPVLPGAAPFAINGRR